MNSTQDIKPKQVHEIYEGYDIVVIFLPESRIWHWQIKKSFPILVEGDAKELNRAIKDAKKWIDGVMEGIKE